MINLFSLGSMVQNGKFSAGADALVSTLKKVDLLEVIMKEKKATTNTRSIENDNQSNP